ncbi:HotDog domain-containing protein [Linnemannia elongata]|nr:HotDog domain-containing protein [Linnemannia elongata]
MAPHNVKNLNEWMQKMRDMGNHYVQKNNEGPGYAYQAFETAKVVDADDDSVTYEYTVLKGDCTVLDTWHGGAIAGLIDNLTASAIFTQKRKYFMYAGVSTDLHVSYVSTVPIGSVVLIECKIIKVGAGLANISAIVKDKASGKVIATALHTRFNNDSQMTAVTAKM